MGLIASPLLRLAILAIFAGVCLLSGFLGGVRVESDHRDAKELKEAQAIAAQVRVVQVHDVTVDATFTKRLTALEATQKSVMAEVLKHATTIPDRPECYLDPERVRVIRDAWSGGASADPSGGSGAVPKAASPTVGKPPASRAVGGGGGLRLPALHGNAPEADRQGEGKAGG
jgi:hypothetical protein